MNTAARLAWRACRAGRHVLCSERIGAALSNEDLIIMEPSGRMQLKGKEGTMAVFCPLLQDGNDMYILKSHQIPVLFGRDDDIRVIEQFLLAAAGLQSVRSPRMLLLQGERGMGKSALLAVASTTILRRSGFEGQVAKARGQPGRGSFHLWHQILPSLLTEIVGSDYQHLAWLEVCRLSSPIELYPVPVELSRSPSTRLSSTSPRRPLYACMFSCHRVV